MNWQQKTLRLGTIKSGVKQTINFYSNEELDIVNIVASCGCTTPKYIKEEKRLEVIYNPGSIPMHLRHTGTFSTTKTITVSYIDGTKDVLTFSAIIVK